MVYAIAAGTIAGIVIASAILILISERCDAHLAEF